MEKDIEIKEYIEYTNMGETMSSNEVDFNCNHESEGFCMFEGLCTYKYHISNSDLWVCQEYCEQWIIKNTNFPIKEGNDEHLQ